MLAAPHARAPTASSSTAAPAPAPAAPKARRRRFTREQLQQHLEILGELDGLLPADRPSLPAPARPSPAGSSGAALKRKATDTRLPGEPSAPKRPRLLPHDTAPADGDHAWRKDGADGDAPSEGRSPPTLAFQPVRRPVRPPSVQDMKHRAEKYSNQGRLLKASGDARHFAAYPHTDKHYKALSDPPPHGSPYDSHVGTMSLLEQLDALVSLVYGVWCSASTSKNYEANYETWHSFREYLSVLKRRWIEVKSTEEHEKALFGLISMIEAFILGRRLADVMQNVIRFDTTSAMDHLKKEMDKCYAEDKAPVSVGPISMLPSPNPSTTAGSASSTPAHGASTPSQAPSAPAGDRSKFVPRRYWEPLYGPTNPPPAKADAIAYGLGPTQVINLHDASRWHVEAKERMKEAEDSLTLPVLFKHFPRTFARMALSMLQARDETLYDIDQDDGELFWPGQLATGEGIGWVCLMGRAMIREYGSTIGYRGVDGVANTDRVKKLKEDPAYREWSESKDS